MATAPVALQSLKFHLSPPGMVNSPMALGVAIVGCCSLRFARRCRALGVTEIATPIATKVNRDRVTRWKRRAMNSLTYQLYMLCTWPVAKFPIPSHTQLDFCFFFL
jgi:hypothetical protein